MRIRLLCLVTTVLLSTASGSPYEPSLLDTLGLPNYDPYAVQARPRLVEESAPAPSYYNSQRRNSYQDQDYAGQRRPYVHANPQDHHYNGHGRTPVQDRDYDPFYYKGTGSRSRRNSKYTTAPLSNHLLNEDVHFFRRDPGGSSKLHALEREAEVSTHARVPHYDRQAEVHGRVPHYDRQAAVHERVPHYDRQTEVHGRGPLYDREILSASRPLTHGLHRPEPLYHGRGSSRLNHYEGRNYHQPQSNHLDSYQPLYEGGPRYSGQAHGHGHGRQGSRGETIEGWSVQVGTQLKVHDDGRARNPGQHYVRDETPHAGRRYPHHRQYDYARQ